MDDGRTAAEDIRALRAVLCQLESLGYQLDTPAVAWWASIVTVWPKPTPSERTIERVNAGRPLYTPGTTMTAIASELGISRHRASAWVSDLPSGPAGAAIASPTPPWKAPPRWSRWA